MGRRSAFKGPTAAALAGIVALTAVLAPVAAAIAALVWRAQDMPGVPLLSDPYLWSVARFTLLQAGLSALLSVGLAIPLSRALARQQAFPGRGLVMRLFALPLGLPALVAVLGIIEVWGRQGIVNGGMVRLGLDRFDVYGLTGILLAHVFFNLPLAVRMLLASLEAVPPETSRLAAQLGFRPRDTFRLIDWPVLKRALPAVFMLIFMLCAASFTVVLTLGGGPGATTLEVAVYQALRFDFDPARAVLLALFQLVLCLVLQQAVARLGAGTALGMGVARTAARPAAGASPSHGVRAAMDLGLIAIATVFVVTPMLAILLSGLAAPLAKLAQEPLVWRAIATSLATALAAALLAVTVTAALIAAQRDTGRLRAPPRWRRAFDALAGSAASLTLAVPPVVLGAGWFVLTMPNSGEPAIAAGAVIVANALMALPFTFSILRPAVAEAAVAHDRLALGLGITGIDRLRLIDIPALARPMGLALAFAMAMSLGDLGVIALFGSDQFTTLPYLLYQRLGSYRSNDAAGLALILAALTLALVWAAERFFGRRT
ncbi:MAG: thiamine/thiamine pyrophosphate ABC transporter permease [Hyphomicrobiales bacterium]